MSERQFPVLNSGRDSRIPKSVPWRLIAPYEEWAQINHYQTIQRLSERGGLAVTELWHVINKRRWNGPLTCGAYVNFEQSLQWLTEFLDADNRTASEGDPRATPVDQKTP